MSDGLVLIQRRDALLAFGLDETLRWQRNASPMQLVRSSNDAVVFLESNRRGDERKLVAVARSSGEVLDETKLDFAASLQVRVVGDTIFATSASREKDLVAAWTFEGEKLWGWQRADPVTVRYVELHFLPGRVYVWNERTLACLVEDGA